MFNGRYRLAFFNRFEFEQNVRNKVFDLYIQYHFRRENEERFFTLLSFFQFKTIGMKKLAKQVLGIDVAQKELVVCLATRFDDLSDGVYHHKIFVNGAKGFEQMLQWLKKSTDASLPVHYVMEATGVYHESLAYFLTDLGLPVSIILPNKINSYAKTLDTKTVTDKTASEAIAQFGVERKTDLWQQPTPVYKKAKQLTRERDQIVFERTLVKNQLHAEKAEGRPNKSSITRCEKRIKMLDQQDKEIKGELAVLVKSEAEVARLSKLLCSIPGIGALTAVTILAETNGFDLIRNKRQLTSYAGLDIKEHTSGTSIKGKTRISKRGNRYLRKCLYMPSLTAIQHDKRFKAIYHRLISKHGIKMKALVAIQRKMLEMTFTVFKTNKQYDKEYMKNKEVVNMMAEVEN